jgi:hypothetical protein
MRKKAITDIYRLSVWIILLMISAASTANGQYEITWSTVDGGGGSSSGGPYTLTGTIGQPDAAYSAGGQYELLGGFWPGGPLCFVDFYTFARFAEQWLETPCDAGNDWCDGADLNQKDGVDFADLRMFVDEWLYNCPSNWQLK